MSGPVYNKNKCPWGQFLGSMEEHEGGNEEVATRLWWWLVDDKRSKSQGDRFGTDSYVTWGHLLDVVEGDQPASMLKKDWMLLKRVVDSITKVG